MPDPYFKGKKNLQAQYFNLQQARWEPMSHEMGNKQERDSAQAFEGNKYDSNREDERFMLFMITD